MRIKDPSLRIKAAKIPVYSLNQFKSVHRQRYASTDFGYNNIQKEHVIEGFEIYSSDGIIKSMGPLKSEFYRISLTLTGTLDMQIGLDHYVHQPHTICFTYPNQIFSKRNISDDIFGYYILFKSDFLNDIIPAIKIADEFPFYHASGKPLFILSEAETKSAVELILKIDDELRQQKTGRVKAIKMYTYLLLLEAKRSYERQELTTVSEISKAGSLLSRFKNLVSIHYLKKRQVSDYSHMLAVSPNHLNRTVKDLTGRTASDHIKEMLLQEAKALLKYTDSSIAQIAYKMNFSDPGSFNRFFKSATKDTPANYRMMRDE